MITSSIDQLPQAARLWVYQSDRAFLPEEKIQIEILTQNFLNQWAAHGSQLQATFTSEYDQFLIIGVDESFAEASGCSIDASVGLVRSLESQFGLSLLDRTKVAVLHEGEIKIYPFNAIKQNVSNREIRPDATIFNNTVTNVGEWKSNWKQKAADSWMKRFFA